jgi:hypothetical protein
MPNNFYTFQTVVESAGTPVALDNQSAEPRQAVNVRAKSDNAGKIYIGHSSAVVADSDQRITLAPGESFDFQVPNTGLIWIDSDENGDGVEVVVGAKARSSGGNGSVRLLEALAGISEGEENDTVLTAPMRRGDAFHAHFNGTSSTSVQEVKAATADKRHYVTDLTISTDTEQWVAIVDGASNVLIGPFYMQAKTTVVKHLSTPVPGSINTALNVDCGGSSGNVTVDLDGYTI